MILEQEYNVLVQFLKNKEPQVSLMDPFILQQLEEKGLLQQNELFGPNPEPGKMINGKFLKEIVIGYKQGYRPLADLRYLSLMNKRSELKKKIRTREQLQLLEL